MRPQTHIATAIARDVDGLIIAADAAAESKRGLGLKASFASPALQRLAPEQFCCRRAGFAKCSSIAENRSRNTLYKPCVEQSFVPSAKNHGDPELREEKDCLYLGFVEIGTKTAWLVVAFLWQSDTRPPACRAPAPMLDSGITAFRGVPTLTESPFQRASHADRSAKG